MNNSDDEDDVVIVEKDLKRLPFRDVVKVAKSINMLPTKGGKDILIQKIIKFNNKKINERLKKRQQKQTNQHNHQKHTTSHYNRQQQQQQQQQQQPTAINNATINDQSNNNNNNNNNGTIQSQNVFGIASRITSKSNNSYISLQHTSVNSSIYTLEIKDITYGEFLFWKVFKNKFIFGQITTFLCVYQFSTKYNELVDLVEMVINGQIELVKYKLSKGHHLDFPFSKMDKLYSRVGNDYQFYNLLFDKYYNVINASLQLQVTDSIRFGNGIVLELLIERFSYVPTEYTMQIAIESCNYKALIHLLEYDSSLFNNDKHWSILIGCIVKFNICHLKMYKIINVLIFQFQKEPSITQVNLLLDLLFTKCPYQLNFKLSHLIQACTTISILNELKNPINTKTTPTNNVNETNVIDVNIDQDDYFEFDEIPQDQESIDINTKYLEYKNSKQKPIVQLNNNYNNSNMLTMDTINSFQFTVKELKFNIDKFNKLNFNVKKLMKMYLSVVPGLLNRNCRYILSFKSKFNWKHFEFKNMHGISDHDTHFSFQYAFKYGNFAFLEQFFKCTKHTHFELTEYSYWSEMVRNYNPNFKVKHLNSFYQRTRFGPTSELPLYQYIKNDRLKQIKFLKDLIAASKNEKIGSVRPSPSFIFKMMVFQDDLDLVKFTYQQFNEPKLAITFSNFGLIRSIKMLEFIYGKFKNSVNQNFNHWISRSEIPLFTRHIQLLAEDPCDIPCTTLSAPNNENTFKYLGFSEYRHSLINEAHCDFGKFMKMIRFIVENPNYFSYNSSIYDECVFALSRGSNDGNGITRYNQIQDLQYIIENTTFNYKRFINIDYIPTTKDGLFINWVLEERHDDIQAINDSVGNGNILRCEFLEFNIVHANYLINRWDLLLEKEDFVTNYKKIWVEIIQMNQVDLVLNIFAKFFPNQQTVQNSPLKPILLDFLWEIVDRNRCEILTAIFNNFGWVFKLQTNGNHNSLFGVDKIRRLLYKSISNENVDIASFFLDTRIQSSNSNARYPIISLTEIQFKKRILKNGRNSNSCICKLFQNRFMDTGGSDNSDDDDSGDSDEDSDGDSSD